MRLNGVPAAAVALSLILHPGPLHTQQFVERALSSGIDHYTYDPTGMAGGVAVFDYNNDGWPDIYLTGGLGSDKLYENRGDGTYSDVSRERRIDGLRGLNTVGVVAGDLNNDGYTDLLLTTGQGDHCHLLLNQGGESFVDRSRAAGITQQVWSSSATLADYDGDGDLDIYVGNYVAYSALPFEQHITRAETDFLYRNEGNLRFTLTESPLPDERAGCTLATLFSDYDGDGAADLFVLNDFGDFYEPNNLLRNSGVVGNPSFERVSERTAMRAAINAMGISSGDVNGDGRLDYYVTNIGDNRLYLSQPDGTFTESARQYYVNDGSGSSWGTVMQDFNQDGYLDLYANKGFLYALDVPQYNRVYLSRDKDLLFDDASRDLILPATVANKARGVAYGDLDRDGDLDLVVAGVRLDPNHTARALIYENNTQSGGHWVQLQLKGTTANASAVGARVRLYTPDHTTLRELTAGGSYLSSHSPVLHFGLGSTTTIDSLVIDWPAPGGREVIELPSVDTQYAFVEGGALTATDSPKAPSTDLGYRVYPNPSGGTIFINSPAQTAQESAQLRLFDMAGRLLSSAELKMGQRRLPVAEHLASGLYHLEVRTIAGRQRIRVIVHR
ncbi:FG-GAP-like repeat-containing protein [Neolewinella sp.]|uniref:FG-GAP-like repeat-containing protein n=1 Tax=Neolewinella sp. TaxID=2993543 RepID=UPI003B527FF4